MNKRIFTLIVAFALFIGNALAQDTAAFKPSGKLWGLVFADYQYKSKSPDSTNLQNGKTQYTLPNGYYNSYSSFEFRRIYLGYDYSFAQNFVGTIVLAHEVSNALAVGGDQDLSGNRTVYIKYANVRWKDVVKGTDVIFGAQKTPGYSTLTEEIYGHRWIEKTILDQRGYLSSHDFGLAVQGKYNDGNCGFEVMVGNDNGAKPESDNFKRFYGEVWAKFMDKKLIAHISTDYKNTQTWPNGPGMEHSLHSQMISEAFVAWQTSPFTVGVEAFVGTQRNGATVTDTAKVADASKADTVNIMPFGISVFASATLKKDKAGKEKIGAFARFDSFNPDTKYSSGLKYSGINGHISETFFVAGIDFTLGNNIHLMPNVWVNSYTENADISNPHLYPGGKGVESTGSDMDYRLTFYWKF